ncbi:hypothetical protein M406DRAFT_329400 [Cryphonectria parasitica EP155]|uniref:Uncharacterized protein n=1 Tax=Cryphonectria parasitica (strain ATCC 38755 / EP155) TaxID=660469 RepID=A0A9P4Y2X1_CRYP1|nr:uncharacterized protein M406DRAFT_329400 [Cryphonectria parasitica EP155]KAF3765494.1 hypothetical protein M406DRAFT_329400 [Cryphonectria parasitica EP155]
MVNVITGHQNCPLETAARLSDRVWFWQQRCRAKLDRFQAQLRVLRPAKRVRRWRVNRVEDLDYFVYRGRRDEIPIQCEFSDRFIKNMPVPEPEPVPEEPPPEPSPEPPGHCSYSSSEYSQDDEPRPHPPLSPAPPPSHYSYSSSEYSQPGEPPGPHTLYPRDPMWFLTQISKWGPYHTQRDYGLNEDNAIEYQHMDMGNDDDWTNAASSSDEEVDEQIQSELAYCMHNVDTKENTLVSTIKNFRHALLVEEK